MIENRILYIIINTILWILILALAPFVILLFIPLYILRKIESLIYKHLYGGLTVPTKDVIWSFQNPKNLPHINGILYVKGVVSQNELIKRFNDIFSASKSCHVSSPGKRLKQYIHDGLTHQYWINDDCFDIENHIVSYDENPLESQLKVQQVISDLIPLEIGKGNKPPWKVYIIPYHDNEETKTAIYFKASHAIADGSSLSYFFLNSMVDKHEGYMPATKYSDQHYQKFFLAGLLNFPINVLKTIMLQKDNNSFKIEKLAGTKEIMMSNKISLQEIKRAKNHYGCSVNDILFSCLATSIQKLLNRQSSENDQTFCTVFPFDVRSSFEEVYYFSNKFATIFIKMLCDSENPIQNLDFMKKKLNIIKISGQPISIDLAWQGISYFLPKFMSKRFVYRYANNTTSLTSSLIGPQYPIKLLDQTVEGITYWAPLMSNQALSFSFLSYNDAICFGVMKDKNLPLDLSEMVATFEKTLHELCCSTDVTNNNKC